MQKDALEKAATEQAELKTTLAARHDEELSELTETLSIQHGDAIEAKVRELGKRCSLEKDETT